MTYRLDITIPGLPPMTNDVLAMNLRDRLRSKKQWKTAVMFKTAGKRPAAPLARAHLTLTRFSTRRPDPDGLTSGFKHVIDALVLANILENDKHENIGFPSYFWEPAKANMGKIRIEVIEIVQGGLNGNQSGGLGEN